jgi:hypothetical protein
LENDERYEIFGLFPSFYWSSKPLFSHVKSKSDQLRKLPIKLPQFVSNFVIKAHSSFVKWKLSWIQFKFSTNKCLPSDNILTDNWFTNWFSKFSNIVWLQFIQLKCWSTTSISNYLWIFVTKLLNYLKFFQLICNFNLFVKVQLFCTNNSNLLITERNQFEFIIWGSSISFPQILCHGLTLATTYLLFVFKKSIRMFMILQERSLSKVFRLKYAWKILITIFLGESWTFW